MSQTDEDISVIGVDRVLKQSGVVKLQVDFGHGPPHVYKPIGDATFDALHDLGVFSAKTHVT